MKRLVCFFIYFTLLQQQMCIANETYVSKDVLDNIDEVILEYLNLMNVPGAAVGIVVNDEIVLSNGYGFRNQEHSLQVTKLTQFPIGSLSKAFTTFVLGQLVDEGLIDWDDKIIDHIPYFKLKDPVTTYSITLRDYLTHISGYPRHDASWFNSGISRKDMIKRLRYLDPFTQFRHEFFYQNLGYMIASNLAENVTGKTWEELASEKILEPLGLKNTNFSIVDLQKNADHSIGYRDYKAGVSSTNFVNVDTVSSSGGMNSSLEDMLKWIKVLMKKGDGYIEEETWNEIVSPHVVSNMIKNTCPGVEQIVPMESYGLGWFVLLYRGHIALFHNGNIEGFSSSILLFPKENIGIVALSNKHLTPFPNIVSAIIADKLLNLNNIAWLEMLKAFVDYSKDDIQKNQHTHMHKHENTHPSHPLSEFQGVYYNDGYGNVEVVVNNGHLEVFFNNMTILLNHYHYNVFEISSEDNNQMLNGLKFTFNENVYGDINVIQIPFEPKVSDIVFLKQKDKNIFSENYLKKFIGKYNYQGFGIKIELIDNSLTVNVFGRSPLILIPERNLMFKFKGDDNNTIQFISNDKDEIIAAQLIQSNNNTFTAYRD